MVCYMSGSVYNMVYKENVKRDRKRGLVYKELEINIIKNGVEKNE